MDFNAEKKKECPLNMTAKLNCFSSQTIISYGTGLCSSKEGGSTGLR